MRIASFEFGTKQLEELTRKHLNPTQARLAKQVSIYPRYLMQLHDARQGYKKYGGRYPQNILFVAGLPKSGTTWLKKMLLCYPGFKEVLFPGESIHALALGGSHDYDLPDDLFRHFNKALICTRMHIHGSMQNVNVLKANNIRHVVLFRDLRDVAISHYFYVRQTPWHPEYLLYSKLDLKEGLKKFAERTLLGFVAWVRSWRENQDPDLCLEISYEQMLSDGSGVMTEVAQHFELDSSVQTINDIIEKNSFKRISGGRKQGQENDKSFFRKGIAGDWKNQFDEELKDLYKELIGDFLIEFNYEEDTNW